MEQFILRLKIILQSNYFYYGLFILVLFYALFRIYVIKYESKLNINNDYVGVIDSYEHKNNKYKFSLKGKENLIVYYKTDDNLMVKRGMKVVVSGEYNEPSSNTIFNNFNYKKYLNNHKTFYIMNANSIKVIDKRINIFYKIKNYIYERCNDLKSGGYIKAFILGDKSSIDEYSLYQANGVSHLFALSGMHIGLLTGILLFLLKKYSKKNFLIILFLIFYLIITIESASLLRSIVFYIMLKINKKFNLDISTKNILLLTISILIIYNPLIIMDMGFEYSAVVTYGLVVCTKYFKKNYFVNLFITSLIAFLFSLPITVYYNYKINMLSIISNLFVVPLVSFIIYPLSLITFIIPYLDSVLFILLRLLILINNLLSSVAFNVVIPKVSIIFYLIYYLFLYLFYVSNNYKYLLFAFFCVFSLKFKCLIDNSINVYYLDVSQGDSSLITYKNRNILIDTGGIKDRTVSDGTIKLLNSLGYAKIDYLILTHGDYDHMGEAINLVENFKVEKVIFNCGEFNELEQGLIEVLEKKKIEYYSCIKELNIDKNRLYFLQTKKYDNENDNSNVIYTELNGYKFMFMGDAGIEKEKDILEKYNISNIDVLKVGHHGSKTSSDKNFINEINPKYSIISVGKNNRYGHPNKEVLNNLKDSKIYRTDQDGSVMIKIKNNKLQIETCRP